MPTTTIGCPTGTLSIYSPTVQNPWNRAKVIHLYHRMGFGATEQEITDALNQSPATLVDQFIDEAIAAPLSPSPVWADWSRQPIDDYTNFEEEAYQHFIDWSVQWLKDMLTNGFRDKLALFWHNHFVTEWYTYYCSSYLYRYHKVLQENALGNFKDFVMAIGKTPAMLLYLDGNLNIANEINENYARELMELFTMGENNGYTEDDVWEVSKALTGWTGATAESCDFYDNDDDRFDPNAHDDSVKTIFGQTGNWGYEEVHDLIFTQRQDEVAQFICAKIYRHFVSPEEDVAIIDGLTTTFKNNNFELAPVFRQLFKSEHFFDVKNQGVCIKSPVEQFVGLLKRIPIEVNDEYLLNIFYMCSETGQTLFIPVDVAGWPGQRAWINENNLTRRWEFGQFMVLDGLSETTLNNLVNLTKTLANNSDDPVVITQTFVNFFIPKGLPSPTEYEMATAVFKGDIPDIHFNNGSWNLDSETVPEQLRRLLNYMLRIPEFQLS